MRSAWVAAWVLSAATARADVAVGVAAPPAPPAKCTMQDGPYYRYRAQWDKLKAGPLYVHDARRRFALMTTGAFEDKPTLSRVVAVGDGKPLAELMLTPRAALVEREDGGIAGVLQLRDNAVDFIGVDSKTRWTAPEPSWGDSAAAILVGEVVLVAPFHRIATGSALFALDAATGKRRWRAEVEQLQVGHSKYFNDVELEVRGATVTLRGYEAAGCYVQTFDLASGKRLSSVMRKTW